MVTLVTVIGGFRSDLSITRKSDGSVGFCRGSRVEGNMSRVEGRGRGEKNVFSCGLYLLGQNSLIFLASGKTKIKNFEFSSSSGRSQF